MRTIRQYPIFREVPTMMPLGAKILDVHAKGPMRETIHVTAAVDTTARLVTRRLKIIGTDKPIPEAINLRSYIGTAYAVYGGLDFHIFDLGEEDFGDVARSGETENSIESAGRQAEKLGVSI